jgi:CheY-like chemotaxis protein
VPKILVADDNANIQKMVSLALEERGISVVSVGNGEAAVRRIPDLDPDLVLADIFMPVRNGYEVCEFVKKDERFAHVPVILLVGAFDPLDEKEARRVGADGVLKKPFVPPDPLIAMVTSALEKNPRVAAELAKAKEAKMAPPPEPVPSIDLSARPEPKPLPEFPEPSPEEAALVYGFGKGVRPDAPADADNETGEVNGPVAIPRMQAAGDEEEEDTQSTTSNWRRSAMDIEIPADVASKPAITDDLEPMSFPSEKEYPPRRVVTPQVAAKVEKAEPALPSSGSSSFLLRQVEEVEEEKSEPPDDFAAGAMDLPKTTLLQSIPQADPPRDSPPSPASEPQSQHLPEPNSTAAGGHWLDAVTSSNASQATPDWMDALRSQSTPVSVTPEPEPEAIEHAEAVSAPSEMAEAPEYTSTSTEPVPSTPSIVDAHQEPGGQPVEPISDQSFFADESEHETAVEEAEEVPAEGPSDSASPTRPEIELDTDESVAPLSFQDPALVQPAAVRVTPEPLLVEEEASGAAQYGTASEETTPLHTFLAPVLEAPVATPEPQPAAASEFFVNSASEASEASEQGSDERIPTMAPPNREALAHIPFLTPPPSFLAELNASTLEQEPQGIDAKTVDSVVQKVLEKLQPQLQELLSQGLLKPLVENILQSEVKKR